MEQMTVTISNIPRDCKGNVLRAGDLVVCARRSGSSTWLSSYKVLRVDDDKGAVLQGTVEGARNRPFYYRAGQGAIMITERAQ